MLCVKLDDEGGVVHFPVDRANSFIEGIVVADEPGAVSWAIRIEWNEVLVVSRLEGGDEDLGYGGYPDGSLDLSGLCFPLAGWRELEGKASVVSFAADDVHPIGPDNPGNFYFDAVHHVPNDNRVQFGRREGVWFDVEWECVAHAYPDDEGLRVNVKTRLPLRQFRVWFRDPTAAGSEAAKQMVLRFARPEEVGDPVRLAPEWVVVPVRSSAGDGDPSL